MWGWQAVLSTVKHSPHPALEQLRTPDYAAVGSYSPYCCTRPTAVLAPLLCTYSVQCIPNTPLPRPTVFLITEPCIRL